MLFQDVELLEYQNRKTAQAGFNSLHQSNPYYFFAKSCSHPRKEIRTDPGEGKTFVDREQTV